MEIAAVPAGDGLGPIGLSRCPSKTDPTAMTGAWSRDLAADLDRSAAWNAAAVVTLLEPHELALLQVEGLAAEVRRRHMAWLHLPIADGGVPGPAFEEQWDAAGARLRQVVRSGAPVFIHCRGGLGWAGSVAARLLVEIGLPAKAAIARVRQARPGAIETLSQEAWVRAGARCPEPVPSSEPAAIRDRALGALLGLAVGDAVGTTLEFAPKPQYRLLADMIGGGPFDLAPGQWTDDTAMALCLAESLLANAELDPADLMDRFLA